MFKLNQLLLILASILIPSILLGQSDLINSKLKSISENVTNEKDCSSSNTYKKLTTSYNFKIENDTFKINWITSGVYKDDDIFVEDKEYCAQLNGINEIFANTSKLKLRSIDRQSIFLRVFEGDTTNQTYISIPILKESDTVYFNRIPELLSNISDKESYKPIPTCQVELIRNLITEKEFYAVKNINLEKRISIDGEEVENYLDQAIVPKLKEFNLTGCDIAILINEDDEASITINDIYATRMMVKSNDLTEEEKKNIIRNLGLMSEKQHQEILGVLENLNWKSGMCKKKNQNSYFKYYRVLDK